MIFSNEHANALQETNGPNRSQETNDNDNADDDENAEDEDDDENAKDDDDIFEDPESGQGVQFSYEVDSGDEEIKECIAALVNDETDDVQDTSAIQFGEEHLSLVWEKPVSAATELALGGCSRLLY